MSFAAPNGVAHAYTYDSRNRLTNLAVGTLASYAYTLDAAGHRTSVAELSGRTVNYTYDTLYRLTSEAIACGAGIPACVSGSVSYTYDPVGNRKQTTSTITQIPAGLFNYDANDRLSTDTYDANGNTVSSGGTGNVYDFENHLISHGAVIMVYDGDGNRVAKTVNGITTRYLVDDLNPTGFAQVIVASIGNSAGEQRHYVYGLERLSQRRVFTVSGAPAETRFYGYDGHGSVRLLTDAAGAVTDTYDYDAFGNLLSSTGLTPNEFRFAGEQFDFDLGLYYNRARYLNTTTGRFWTMDTAAGNPQTPSSLHRYLFASADPVDRIDPSGLEDLVSLGAATAIAGTIAGLATIGLIGLYARGNLTQGDAEQPPSAAATSTNMNSIEIINSRLSADEFFSGFMSRFDGVTQRNVSGLTGWPVGGVGQKLTFSLKASSPIGALSVLGQSPFSVRTIRYDSREHTIAVVTLAGHPLRGYRYWRVFSPDSRPGHIVIETAALDEPGPGPFDQVKFLAGRNQQLGIWREYLQEALTASKPGYEGTSPQYDFPGGFYGVVSKFEVLEHVTGSHP